MIVSLDRPALRAYAADAVAAPTFDLQSHSLASDGALPPALVVQAAYDAGVELLALTDHDTVAGVDEALAAASALGGITVIPAAEISALDGDHEDLHICAYGIDQHDPGLLIALERWRLDRHERAANMAQALREHGLQLALPEQPPGARPIGRPHLAQAVLEHPANAERLAREGLTDSSQVLEAYLLPGTPGYRRRTTPTVQEAIEVIHRAGGLAVWAHPFWDLDSPEEVRDTLERFQVLGLDGVEAFYITHTREQTLLAADAAAQLGLLTTGSADFHGPAHKLFHAFRAFDLCGRDADLGPLAPG